MFPDSKLMSYFKCTRYIIYKIIKTCFVRVKRERIMKYAKIFILALDMSKIISNKNTVIFKINFFNKF
jgi:hypothetical protein